MDWLTEFVQYKSAHSEVGPRLLYWTGVSTIAGALRRKVWIDQIDYQWTPNFYIIFVGQPGMIRKSTSIDMGMRLLAQVPDINFGPEIATWQSLITYIADQREQVEIDDPDRPFSHSSVTIALSEFGTFFKAEEKDLVDNLTNLWDGKLGTIKKMTKTNGNDEMVNAFINIIAATTPDWMANNFPDAMVGGGFASRCILLYGEDSGKDIAYPARHVDRAAMALEQEEFGRKLRIIGEYKGQYEITEAAYDWGEEWYKEQKKMLRGLSQSLEAGFLVRKQVHLHKLAMVISAANYKFPVIDVGDFIEAEKQLAALDGDTQKIFGFVGQTKVSKAAREILDIITKVGNIERRELYRKYFFRTMNVNEFREAVDSVIMGKFIAEYPGRGLCLRSAVAAVRLVK